jgi:N-methylhydantoinase B
MGTWGATSEHDGQEGVPHMGANQTNVPVEMIEAEYPIRIERYGFVPDTGGPGRYRGGVALFREYRLLADEAVLNVRSDKRDHPPHGLFGGKTGAPSMSILETQAGARVLPVLTTEPIPMRRGDLFRHVIAGGGGYGDPLEREPERVLKDVIAGKVTSAHAAEAYGVIVTEEAKPLIDHAATAACRNRLRRAAAD